MTKISENIKVGISIGDLNGIGSEVVLKTFEDSRRGYEWSYGWWVSVCYLCFYFIFLLMI